MYNRIKVVHHSTSGEEGDQPEDLWDSTMPPTVEHNQKCFLLFVCFCITSTNITLSHNFFFCFLDVCKVLAIKKKGHAYNSTEHKETLKSINGAMTMTTR